VSPIGQEDWLPLNRDDYGVDAVQRFHVRALATFKSWEPPKAKKLATK